MLVVSHHAPGVLAMLHDRGPASCQNTMAYARLRLDLPSASCGVHAWPMTCRPAHSCVKRLFLQQHCLLNREKHATPSSRSVKSLPPPFSPLVSYKSCASQDHRWQSVLHASSKNPSMSSTQSTPTMSSTQSTPNMSSTQTTSQIGPESSKGPQEMHTEPETSPKVLKRKGKSRDLNFEQAWGELLDEKVSQELHKVRMLPLYRQRSWSSSSFQSDASLRGPWNSRIRHLMLLDLLVRLIASS